MDTKQRPELRPGRTDGGILLGEGLLVVGFAGFVLGVYEIGGLFMLGVGFALVWTGMVVSFLGDRRRRQLDDEAFRWVVDGPD